MENTFRCTSCGACCKKQRWTVEASGSGHIGTFGMMLLTGEKNLFEHIEPMWRGDGTVLVYQSTDEPCQHWHGSRCSIYKRRPLACRAYPVWWELVWRADTNCPVVAAGPKLANFPEQTLAAHEIMRFMAWVYGAHQELEYFDLGTKTWRTV